MNTQDTQKKTPNQATNNLSSFLTKMKQENQTEGAQQAFSRLYNTYLKNPTSKLDWSHIKPLKHSDFINYDDLVKKKAHPNLGRMPNIAVLKLNGGLGTSMGCTGPKSLIDVWDGKTFLDITVEQMANIQKKANKTIPFLLLNSFNTERETSDSLNKKNIAYTSILQNQFPKIDATSQEPFEHKNKHLEWNPPGHGDVYLSLYESGTLDELEAKGIEYIFISNADNLGATIDPYIPTYMKQERIDFLMETTPKTLLDVKGGTLVRYNDKLTLLERSQVEDEHIKDFEDVSTFSIFNTNSIWISVTKIKQLLSSNDFTLPLIVNPKKVDDTPIIQLEIAMGAAIHLFDNPKTCVVPRHRFLPVKKTSDLLLLRSDFITKSEEGFTIAPEVNVNQLPKITLGPQFDTVEKFNKRVLSTPSMKHIKSLHIDGNYTIKENVTFKGHVNLTHKETNKILENCVVDETTQQ